MKPKFIFCVFCCMSGVFCFTNDSNLFINLPILISDPINLPSQQTQAETSNRDTTKLSNEVLTDTGILHYSAVSDDVFETSTLFTGYHNTDGTYPTLFVVEIVESSPITDDPADNPILPVQTSKSRKQGAVECSSINPL